MTLKQELYDLCFRFIENRLDVIQKSIDAIQESLMNETKSSAGDKHETGRAMLQLEREKAGLQLAEVNKTKQELLKVNIERTPTIIGPGAVVYTSDSNYFIAISVGELEVDNKKFYAISPSTPIGERLLGKVVGDRINFRSQEFEVIRIH